MIPQAGLFVSKIFRVEKKLMQGFLQVFRLSLNPAHIGKEQHCHEQRIVPKLLIVPGVGGDVLEASLLGSGEMLHNPFCALPAGSQIPLRAQIFSEIGHCQEGSHGVYVQGGEADGKLIVKVFSEDLQIFLVAGFGKELPQAV